MFSLVAHGGIERAPVELLMTPLKVMEPLEKVLMQSVPKVCVNNKQRSNLPSSRLNTSVETVFIQAILDTRPQQWSSLQKPIFMCSYYFPLHISPTSVERFASTTPLHKLATAKIFTVIDDLNSMHLKLWCIFSRNSSNLFPYFFFQYKLPSSPSLYTGRYKLVQYWPLVTDLVHIFMKQNTLYMRIQWLTVPVTYVSPFVLKTGHFSKHRLCEDSFLASGLSNEKLYFKRPKRPGLQSPSFFIKGITTYGFAEFRRVSK